MSKAYKRKDHLYQKAKEEGFRSRAAYKLIELQDKYSIIKKQAKILDLGCFPGGWLQVAADSAGPQSQVVGIDLKEVEPFPANKYPQVEVLKLDLFEEEKVLRSIAEFKIEQFDVIISDMSPPLTGIKDKDQAGSFEVFTLALRYCQLLLKPGKGAFLCKVFPSQELEDLFKKEKKNWSSLQKTVLKSSRNSSNELYVIGKGFLQSK